MREDDLLDPGALTDEDTGEFAAVNVALRTALSRQLVIAVLPPPGGDPACDDLCARLAAFPEVRVVVETYGPHLDHLALKALLRVVADGDADALLVWTTGEALAVRPSDGTPAQAAMGWPRQVLCAAEDVNLLDNCFTAPIGPGVTREAARHAGYEDGYPAEIRTSRLVRALGREAQARAEIRRRGSSPPCYL
jgi:hypothetical protein